MTSFTFHDKTTGGNTDSHDSAWVAVYDTDGVSSGYLAEAYSFVINCVDSAYDDNHISGYDVRKRSVNDWTPDCQSSNSVISQWNDLRDRFYINHDGVHILIHSCSTDYVPSGTTDGSNPWDNDCGAVATTDENERNENGVAGTCFHESLHAMARSNVCVYVEDMIENDNEHTLGIIRSCGFYCDEETPIGTTGAADKGECDKKTADSRDKVTSNLSECEMKAMGYSADHTAGHHGI